MKSLKTVGYLNKKLSTMRGQEQTESLEEEERTFKIVYGLHNKGT